MAWRSTQGETMERAVRTSRQDIPHASPRRCRARYGRSRRRWRGGFKARPPSMTPEGRRFCLALPVQLRAGPEQVRKVVLLPGQGLTMPGIAGLRFAEDAGVVDRPSGAVGDPAQVVMEHLVVDDALQEVLRHVAAAEHGMDADPPEPGIVAAEGQAAPARAAAAPAPGEGDAQGRGEEARVLTIENLLQGRDAAAGPERGPL